MVPTNISELFLQNLNIHNYITRRKKDIHIPKIKLELGKRIISLNGPLHYNNLPTKVKEASSLLSFKIQIWKHLRLTSHYFNL